MKKEKFVIQPGKICTLDPENIFKQNDMGTIHVEIIERVKWKPFGGSIWRVRDTMNDDVPILSVPEKLLFPYGMSVIRNPLNLPIFNRMDLHAINTIIYGIENPDPSNNEEIQKNINRLKAVENKIRLAISLTEV